MNLTSSIGRSMALVIILMITFGVYGQRKMEELDRGVLAVRDGLNNYISWRILATELRNVSYNIYRDGVKINSSAITGASNYTDEGAGASSTYSVTAIIDGVEQPQSEAAEVWANSYMDIPMQPVNGTYDTYNLNDASIGDLDGDGEYEVIIKRLPNYKDESSTDYNLLEAYELDGTLMWQINMGPNLYDGTETNFSVWDYDGDGKAEIIARTSDGMIDGLGNNIGDRDEDGTINYRYSVSSFGYRTDGPDYISVFNGETGEEMDWDYYINREPLTQWGPSGVGEAGLSHRATKCMFTPAYLDGKNPSVVMGRGIYERIKMEAWDWDGTNLTKRWAWDSSPGGVASEFHGQGNHQLSCADVDNDGCDEIVYGSMIIDNTGVGLYSTGFGHGDALHVSDMDPDREGLELWQCLEGGNYWGATFRDAASGELYIRYRSNRDCGRCAAGDISEEHSGFELWAATECPMYNTKGDIIGDNNVAMNHMVYWDGDLMREFLDHSFSTTLGYGIPNITKYNSSTQSTSTLLSANDCASNNWTKGNPSIQADILGDWREEVIWRTNDNTALRIYTTTDPTEFRMPTLMHEPQYRIAVSWQNNSYNQPPHTAIYLGNETEDAVPYPVINNKIAWESGPDWGDGTATWIDEDQNTVSYDNAKEVLFDFIGDNSSAINLTTTLTPKSVTLTSHTDYVFEGTGKLSGDMELLKAGTGTLTINNTNDYSGTTKVYYGPLVLNETLSSSPVEVCMFGKLFLNGTAGNGIIVKSRGQFNIGNQEGVAASANVQNGLTFNEGAKAYIDLSNDPSGTNDAITLVGDLNINGECSFNFNRLDGSLNSGLYDLITFDGTFNGSVDDIIIEGLNDVACELQVSNGKLSLNVLEVRAATSITWSGSVNNIWDFAGEENWDNNGAADWFLGNDDVTFNDDGSTQTNIDITEIVPIGSMTMDATIDYTFDGVGKISGSGGLTKNGTGKLFIHNINDFTGPVALNGGLTQVEYISNGGQNGPLGASTSDASNFAIDGGVLSITGSSTTTDRSFTIGSSDATLYVYNGSSMTVDGQFTGTGDLIKGGDGTLILNEANTHAATQINSGTLVLNSENSNISGLGSAVTIKNATLQMANTTGSYSDINWDMIVPSGYTATAILDGRCSMYGSLTGAGTLNLSIPYVRSELFGDWSAFTGTINAYTSNEGWLIFGNTAGYANASIYLGDEIFAVYRSSNDVTIELGELTGSESSELGAGGEQSNTITWKVGGKGSSVQFDGRITNTQFKGSGATAAIIKTGGGRWTLTNSNTYSGGTIIERGTIIASNSSGSATGTGTVEVMTNAALEGNGTVTGSVIINSRGYLMPGLTSAIGTLTIDNDVTFNEGGRYYVKVDAATPNSDKFSSTGTVTLSGTLYFKLTNGSFAAGQSYQIIDAASISGEFSAISPSSPGDGLYWDTSSLTTDGIVRITDTSTSIINTNSTYFVVYPNPAKDAIWIEIPKVSGDAVVSIKDLAGRVVQKDNISLNGNTQYSLNDLRKGMYLVFVSVDNELYQSKLVIE